MSAVMPILTAAPPARPTNNGHVWLDQLDPTVDGADGPSFSAPAAVLIAERRSA